MPNFRITNSAFLKSKNVFFLVLILITGIIAISIIIFYIYQQEGVKRKVTSSFLEGAKQKTLSRSDSDETSKFFEDQFSTIQNINLTDEERYKAVQALVGWLEYEYYKNRNPETRTLVNSLYTDFANNEFPNLFNENRFSIICADPVCGEKSPVEIVEALELITKTNLNEHEKDIIASNLKTAAYLPKSSSEDKIFGIKFSIYQLQNTNDPVGSQAAELLISYLFDKYKETYSRESFE
ncbi:MAG: hypothetical protein HYW63_04380 [Candidatus Levybacteria bacterium]|nr:hypothetical protein [Candidatus Levybacteria bacterium]